MYDKFPAKVNIIEVGPRDGFQNVAEFIPTQDKLAIIHSLFDAGVSHMELTSFVSPRAIPQLADAGEICRAVVDTYGDSVKIHVLVPNLKGAQSAFDAGVREAVCVMSVSEAHNKANINRTHEQSLQELGQMLEALPDMKIRVALATSFACPFEGWIAAEKVLHFTDTVWNMGAQGVVLCDTIGVATPDRVYKLSALARQKFPGLDFSLHLHDTRGMGLANIIAGLEAGITTFEASVGGLGGCPFAPGAAGNTATEDVVNMLGDMGINTGIDLDKYLAAVKLTEQKIKAPLTGHMGQAKIYDCLGLPHIKR